MHEQTQSRRNFLVKSFRSALSLGAASLLGQEVLASCSPVKAATRQIDDLQALKAAIADRQKPMKWIFTGDSITQGAKHTLGYRSYPEIFSEHVRFEMNRSRDFIINTAVSGQTTREILADFDWRIAQFSPAVVSLMIGTNDAAKSRRIPVEEYGKNLETLVQKIRALKAIPVLQTPNTIEMGADPTKNERSDLPFFVETMRKLADQHNLILIDHWRSWEVNQEKVVAEKWRNDPLHPNGKGHLEMARLLFQHLDICDDRSFTCSGHVPFC
ncbi:SGNH/GDSL hydrolase family protein [Flavisolibacter nicotianae]|uniref:SGNH/GDSL hydrolase family protein n=1 Tax=Flavisolibacter nicotianae TaxID=2364882 RepID=UPI000EB05BFA|nr:SGNH/GDSL hydrolase family protein [Flavisolibacter nicotianae]